LIKICRLHHLAFAAKYRFKSRAPCRLTCDYCRSSVSKNSQAFSMQDTRKRFENRPLAA
jgi:sulfatase maturation enzyme AslB (radical SAM superfamily)